MSNFPPCFRVHFFLGIRTDGQSSRNGVEFRQLFAENSVRFTPPFRG